MSLINDALKRAKAAQDQAPQPDVSIPHLKPVESAPGGFSGRGLVLPVALTAVAVGGLLFLWHAGPGETHAANAGSREVAATPAGTRSKTSEAVAEEQGRGGTRPTTAPLVGRSVPERREGSNGPNDANLAAHDGGPGRTALPEQLARSGQTTSNAPAAVAVAPAVAANASTNLAQAPVAPPPRPAPPRLQGILFNPNRPSAMISGKTVYVGDRVLGFQVAAITRDSATLVGPGVTNRLSLEP